ncbi:hypothetical protein [Mycolicibacillus koreensis]|uniref:hypothetical protein n=1 Tax=Mycolicibacillus koreensis TaxID=1069220 RepID=UPI001F460CDE|nr:hypothetical protein [Mycolicibacillus koreensis]
MADASARRQENRVTMRTASSNVRRLFGGDASAVAVKNLSPSMLSNLLVSLEAVTPGVSGEILRSPSGSLRRVPGMHNDVFSEVRERSNEAALRLNGGKFDPKAVSRVELASALCERDMVENGAIRDPLAAADELERISARIDAIASGAMVAPPAGTAFADLPERTRKFYARHSMDETAALTTVSQRISDKLFEDVTERAQVAAAPRAVSPLVERLSAESVRPVDVSAVLTQAGLQGSDPTAGVEIADGVTLVSGSGGPAVLVDGLRMPVSADARIADVVGRIPAVDFDSLTEVPADRSASGVNAAVQSMMVGKSPRAQSMRLAARRRVIERTFYGDTVMGQSASSAGVVHQLPGKARAHTASALASRPHSSRHGADAEATTARIEGFDLSRHMRYATAARKEFLDAKVPDEIRVARAQEATLKRYAGDVPAEDRDAAARAGFRVRHRANTVASDYPGAQVMVDWTSTESVSPEPPGKALSPEHADVRSGGVRMVMAANQIAQRGRNPELCDAEVLVASAKMASAFDVYRMVNRDVTPRVVTATQTVPASYRGREADFIRDVFPTGGAFTTRGYVLGRRDGVSGSGKGRVRVRYFTGDAMPITGGDVIDTGTTFRVESATVADDGTVEVNAVADQVLAASVAQ